MGTIKDRRRLMESWPPFEWPDSLTEEDTGKKTISDMVKEIVQNMEDGTIGTTRSEENREGLTKESL